MMYTMAMSASALIDKDALSQVKELAHAPGNIQRKDPHLSISTSPGWVCTANLSSDLCSSTSTSRVALGMIAIF